ncbi:MAG: sigma-54 dependent transcriptional regulator [Rhodobacter sp.]|nr:sigma-54 dependent transcriptional regulator [Rhodobacter sp.]
MAEAAKIAIIDDETDMRQSIRQWLALSGFDAEAYPGAEQALETLGPDYPGAVVTDIKMPGMDGMQFLRRLMVVDNCIPVIMITGHGDVQMAVEAIKLGAYDFLEKPFDPDHMTRLAGKATDYRRLVLDNRALRTELSGGGTAMRKLAGESREMDHLRGEIVDLGQADGHILVDGETGVGKTLVAHALHAAGTNAGGKLVLVSCAAHDEKTLAGNLFGPKAVGSRSPALADARAGTVVLEDIEALPPALQSRLLSWINEQGKPPQTRIIAISNLGERDGSCEEALRPDLYFRLAALKITPPPLRRRGEDILQLFGNFCERFSEEYGCEVPEISARDAAELLRAPWPGNVRQLRNVAERAVLQGRHGSGTIASLLTFGNEAQRPAGPTAGRPLRDRVEDFERTLIDRALRRYGGSVIKVMGELSLPRRTLNEKMTKYGLHRSDYL